MPFSYLSNKNWVEITREERLFCSHLYHRIKDEKDIKSFVDNLNTLKSPINEFKNNISLESKNHWEAGFEVCFYRDLLKERGIGVKKDRESLLKSVGKESVDNLIKRTFDLALFSEDVIVIIEAKASQGISRKQFKEFEKDEELITKLFKHLHLKVPAIRLIILASSSFFVSKSFSSLKGVGRNLIIEKQKRNECKVNALLSWEQMNDILPDKLFERAEALGK